MGKIKKNLIRQTGFTGKVLSTGLTGGICVALSLFAGYQFDLYFNTKPLGIIVGILLGLAAAAVQTYKQIKESFKEFDRTNNPKRKD
ncbi:MAG: AtpZ/AtpI family protein [Candidatus Rifleibacteriota bacterium]